jgi:hypothetical protein
LVAAFSIAAPPADEANPVEVTPVETTEPTLPTADEARGRARLLHETIHSTLQVVHHQYYREDEGLMIPAATMKRVFAELAKRQKVEVRWLAVDGQVMNSDHDPQDDFEKQAVAALASGKPEFDQSTDGVYRRAGPITLGSDCLKCHLPNRTSTEDRLAGLIITMKTRAP